jgi:hypothetical protein
MKELIHQNNNLLTISSFNYEKWGDSLFFKHLIEDFSKEYRFILSTNMRSLTIKHLKVIEDANKLLQDENIIFWADSEYVCAFVKEAMTEDMYNLIVSFWATFEHNALIFTNDLDPFVEIFQFGYEKTDWYDLVHKARSFIFFKGLQEEVIWIGKNGNLDFPEINLNDSFW